MVLVDVAENLGSSIAGVLELDKDDSEVDLAFVDVTTFAWCLVDPSNWVVDVTRLDESVGSFVKSRLLDVDDWDTPSLVLDFGVVLLAVFFVVNNRVVDISVSDCVITPDPGVVTEFTCEVVDIAARFERLFANKIFKIEPLLEEIFTGKMEVSESANNNNNNNNNSNNDNYYYYFNNSNHNNNNNNNNCFNDALNTFLIKAYIGVGNDFYEEIKQRFVDRDSSQNVHASFGGLHHWSVAY